MNGRPETALFLSQMPERTGPYHRKQHPIRPIEGLGPAVDHE
jgi:hypothetical protein